MSFVARSLAVGYGKKPLFDRVELAGNDAEFVCVLGRNGAGKTTLLRTLAGLKSPLSGSVSLDGRDLQAYSSSERARVVSVVLTDRPYVSGMSARDVVAMGRQPFTNWFGVLQDIDTHIIAQSLDAVGVSALSERAFETLSDGERQRVMIARALAQQPKVLLLDEVTAFLDLPGRVAMMSMLRQAARDGNMVVILSTHDLDLAMQFADYLWVLTETRGIVTGVPEDLARTGVLAACFDSSQAVFSSVTGTFEVRHRKDVVPISLHGEGPERAWMERALIREGYAPQENRVAGACHLSLQSDAGSAVDWLVDSAGLRQHCASIEEVLVTLPRPVGHVPRATAISHVP